MNRYSTGTALAAREDSLSEWLTDHQIDRDWVIAPALAAAGVDVEWCDRAATLLEGHALQAGLEWVAQAVTMTTLIAEAQDSTRRISELVAAVRAYSQLDRGTVQRIDVTEGLESTLVMLAHKLKSGVVVQRSYAEDLPQVEASPGELNQVWTNLIDNAIDAMDGAGELRVSTYADDLGIVVEIADTGPGMTDEVARSRLRAVLHHQGGRQGHRARPRHLPPDRRGAARRRDHRRLAARGHRRAGSAAASRRTGLISAADQRLSGAGVVRATRLGPPAAAVRGWRSARRLLWGTFRHHPDRVVRRPWLRPTSPPRRGEAGPPTA